MQIQLRTPQTRQCSLLCLVLSLFLIPSIFMQITFYQTFISNNNILELGLLVANGLASPENAQ